MAWCTGSCRLVSTNSRMSDGDVYEQIADMGATESPDVEVGICRWSAELLHISLTSNMSAGGFNHVCNMLCHRVVPAYAERATSATYGMVARGVQDFLAEIAR